MKLLHVWITFLGTPGDEERSLCPIFSKCIWAQSAYSYCWIFCFICVSWIVSEMVLYCLYHTRINWFQLEVVSPMVSKLVSMDPSSNSSWMFGRTTVSILITSIWWLEIHSFAWSRQVWNSWALAMVKNPPLFIISGTKSLHFFLDTHTPKFVQPLTAPSW